MTNNNNKSQANNITKVVLTCDLGASQIKAIAQVYPDGIPCVLAMSPEIADVPKGSLERLSHEQLQSNTTWVGIEDEYYILGALASVFGGTAGLRDLKYQYAPPKITGLLWLACRKFNLDGIEACIQILLPPGEVNDGKQLGQQLIQILRKGILTPTGRLKAKVLSFDVSGEGSGIMAYHRRSIDESYFQKNIGMLMLGYRNASFALSQKGNPAKGESTELGMSWMVNSFVERTAVGLSKDDSRLVTALLAAGGGNFNALRSLSRKTTDEGIKSDLALFQKVLPVVREEYCRALLRWVRNIAALDEVVICGGTADFVRTELTQHFEKESIPIVWNGNVTIPERLDTLNLGTRVTDVWTSHISHIKMLDKNLGYDRQGRPLLDPNKSMAKNPKATEEEWIRMGYTPMRKGI